MILIAPVEVSRLHAPFPKGRIKSGGIAIVSNVDCKLRRWGFVLCEGRTAEQHHAYQGQSRFLHHLLQGQSDLGWVAENRELLHGDLATLENLREEDIVVFDA